jgi:hypothetical protein
VCGRTWAHTLRWVCQVTARPCFGMPPAAATQLHSLSTDVWDSAGVQLLLVYMVTLLGLFGNFYISKHHAAVKSKKKAIKKTA